MDAKNWTDVIQRNKERILSEAKKAVSATINLNIRFIVGIDINENTYARSSDKEVNPYNWTGNTCDLFIITSDYKNIPQKILESHFELEMENKLEKIKEGYVC